MTKDKRLEADGKPHHPPKSVEQQSEDSFPASDPPSFSSGSVIGAPVERESGAETGESLIVKQAQKAAKAKRKKVQSGA